MNNAKYMVHVPIPRRKVTAPSLPLTIVHRTAPLQRLNELIYGNTSISPPYKLLLLEAPAGYGKTTLLAEFAQQGYIPCCWSFLDHRDNEPQVFLRTLLRSIQQFFPSFGAQLPCLPARTTRSDEQCSSQTYLESLLEALTKEVPQRFVLFLCNYQEVGASPEITALMAFLLNHLPEQGMVVLESREIPNLDFASLLAKRAMVGLGREFFRFTPQEVCALALLHTGQEFSLYKAEQLVHLFDGWITGLLLGTQLGDVQFLHHQWRHSPSLHKGHTSSQALLSYLANEVFKGHQQAYTFLQEAVIVQEMTPSLCSDLLEITQIEAGKHLQHLEQFELFIARSNENDQTVYTCSPFLRELLYEKLRQQNPERFLRLHQRAAELLEARRRYPQAITHALEAQSNDVAIRLICASAEDLLGRGEMQTLQQWIELFPPATIAQYPRLLLIQATIFLHKSELHMALPLLAEVAEWLNDSTRTFVSPLEVPHLRTELALLRVQALLLQGEYIQAQGLSQQVLAGLPASAVDLLARAHLSCGTCAQFLGDLTARIIHYQKALQLWGRDTITYLTADGYSALAETYGMLGRFMLAQHHSTRAQTFWEHLQYTPGGVKHLVIHALLQADQGQFDEAKRLLQQAVDQARNLPHCPAIQSYTLVNLSAFYQDYGLYSCSLVPAEEGLALARQLGDRSLLNQALMTLALTYLHMGDATTATLLLEETRLENTSQTSINSSQQIQRDLLQGTIWLRQKRYAQACPLLRSTEAALSIMGTRRIQLKALVRLTACYIGQQRFAKALEQWATVEQILVTCPGYQQYVHAEAQAYPGVWQTLRQRGENSCLQALQSLPPAPQLTVPDELKEAPRIKFLALGEPIVLLDEQPITCWRMARAMELCFYLLECGQPVRKEQILEALWGIIDQRTSRTFYSTMHYLRKALGGELTILSGAGVYTLNLPLIYGEDHVWYDVSVFAQHFALGKQAVAEGNNERARAAFEAMMKLYRGNYVQSFAGSWCIPRRAELQRLYLEARRQLAQLPWQPENAGKRQHHFGKYVQTSAFTFTRTGSMLTCV